MGEYVWVGMCGWVCVGGYVWVGNVWVVFVFYVCRVYQ